MKPGCYRSLLTDGVGFEPTNPCGLAVFKTAALNHSATHPGETIQVFSMASKATERGRPRPYTETVRIGSLAGPSASHAQVGD